MKTWMTRRRQPHKDLEAEHSQQKKSKASRQGDTTVSFPTYCKKASVSKLGLAGQTGR